MEISVDMSFLILLLGLGGLLLGCGFGLAGAVRLASRREAAVSLLPLKRQMPSRLGRSAGALRWIRRKLPGRRGGRSGQDEPSSSYSTT